MHFKMFFGLASPKLNIGTKKQYENSCFVFQELAINGAHYFTERNGTERNKLKHYFTEQNGTDRKLILHVISSKRHVIKPGMGNSFGIH